MCLVENETFTRAQSYKYENETFTRSQSYKQIHYQENYR